MLDESNPPYSTASAARTCDGFPCLVHAKSDAEVLGVRPALEHPNVTLLTNAKVVRLETNGAGTAVTEVVVERDGEDGALRGRHRRRRLRRGQHGQAAARVGERQAPERPRERLRPGRPQLHVPRQPRPCSRSRARRTRPSFQKTLGLNDFYFGADDFEYPLGNIQMVGKSTAPMFRGEKPRRDEARARVDARADGKPRDRLLALDRGSAAARQPRHRRRATATSASPTRRRTTRPKKRLYEKLQVDARRSWT